MGIRKSNSDRIYVTLNYVLATILVAAAAYPFIYVFSMSISDPYAAAGGKVVLWPVGFDMTAYQLVLRSADIWNAFSNTVWVVIVGTTCMVVCTLCAAYPLSRKHFFARKFFNGFIAFTMFFWAGLIPFFQVVKMTGLYGNRWVLVIPYMIEAWNFVICRTFFQSLPETLMEAATIDGCGEFQIMTRVALPLSKQIIAVMALFYGVSNWNGWFAAQIFLPDANMQLLQNVLKRLLVESKANDLASMGMGTVLSKLQLKYAIVVVASIPMIAVYPFVQRYFEKGVMIGSIKG